MLFAICPEHNKRTSICRGQTVDIEGHRWDVWRCPAKDGHLFYAEPAPNAPKTAEELKAFVEASVLTTTKKGA